MGTDTLRGTISGGTTHGIVLEVEKLESGLVRDAEGTLYEMVTSGQQHFFTRVEEEADALIHEGLTETSDLITKEAQKFLWENQEPPAEEPPAEEPPVEEPVAETDLSEDGANPGETTTETGDQPAPAGDAQA